MRNFHLPGRSPAFATNGMCATSHPLAAQTALEILKSGGNAVDAAISGQGVALVSRFLVSAEIPAQRLVQVTPQTLLGKQDFYLLVERKSKRNRAIDTAVNWFLARADT